MHTRGVVSIGVPGALGPQVIGRIAAAVERAGFHALWVNDTPGGDSLAALAAAAAASDRLVLATGVIPLDRRPAGEIAEAVGALGLPQERLVVGIGSGGATRGAVRLVREGIGLLRERLSARVAVGALGPRMRRLGAEEAGGVLLNWLSADAAADQSAEAHAVSAGAHVALYVRTALEKDAVARRDAEADRYGAIPAYAVNFSRLGFGPRETLLPRDGEDGIAAGVAAYAAGLDEVVLRAIPPADTETAYLRFVDDARAQLGGVVG